MNVAAGSAVFTTRIAGLAGAVLIPGNRIARRLALAALIDAFGTGMFLTGSAIYFTRVIGLSPAQVGLGLSVAGLAGLLTSVPLGALGDRVGPGRLYVALQLARALGFAAYPLVGGVAEFVVAATVIEVGDAAIPGIAQAVVGLAAGEEHRVTTLAKIRAVFNLGFGLGAVAATGVLAIGSEPAFLAMVLVNAAATLVGAVVLQQARITALRGAPVAGRRFELVRDGSYLAAALLNGVLSIHITLLFVGLPLWLADHTRVPVALIGVLVVINTVMAVALQTRFAERADRLAGAISCMVRAGLALAAFAVVAHAMARTQDVAAAVMLAFLAVVLLTCGELWQSAGGWAISFELAPPDRQAQHLATFQLGTAVQAMAAPALIVGLVFPYESGWLGLAVITAAAGLLVRPRRPRRRRLPVPFRLVSPPLRKTRRSSHDSVSSRWLGCCGHRQAHVRVHPGSSAMSLSRMRLAPTGTTRATARPRSVTITSPPSRARPGVATRVVPEIPYTDFHWRSPRCSTDGD